MTMSGGGGGGGETAKDVSAWTPDILKAYFERILHEVDRRYSDKFVAQEKAVAAGQASAAEAVAKAEANAEKWRANANEWRAAMTDREENFMARTQANAMFDGVNKQIDGINKQLLEMKTREAAAIGRSGGLSAGWGYLIGIVGLAATIIAIIVAVSNR